MYLNEDVEDRIVKIIFVVCWKWQQHSPKNLSAELHGKHWKKMVGKKLEYTFSFENIQSLKEGC